MGWSHKYLHQIMDAWSRYNIGRCARPLFRFSNLSNIGHCAWPIRILLHIFVVRAVVVTKPSLRVRVGGRRAREGLHCQTNPFLPYDIWPRQRARSARWPRVARPRSGRDMWGGPCEEGRKTRGKPICDKICEHIKLYDVLIASHLSYCITSWNGVSE